MKKNAIMVLMVVFVFCFSCLFVSGCAKKSTIKDAEAIAPEKSVSAAETTSAQPDAQRVAKPAEQAPEREVEKKIAAPAREVIAAGPSFELIHFDYDKYDLKPESRVILNKIFDFLKNNPKYILRVEGHCDERGTAEYNMALGQRRAEEAMKYLVKLGIDEARLTTLSYGKEIPLDPESTEAAWAKNRRAEFVPILTR
ncbi:MAG: OmpA family protein [Deltaproteobacteria bacterium]|nr:OmpA family protein [Deltaproteobacteria bacterium]